MTETIPEVAKPEAEQLPVTLPNVQFEDFLTDGKLDIKKFFEFQFGAGVPIYRFVDDMEVDWNDMAHKVGRSAEECKSQYQYMLDILFEKSQFAREDRELLYKVITGGKTYDLKTSEAGVPEHTLKEIQSEYFPEYSSEVVKIEILAALENFKLFIQENRNE